MAGDRKTMVTEVVTGLGMLGLPTVDDALYTRPSTMVSLSPEDWTTLAGLHAGGAYAQEFGAAWANGAAFFEAQEGLRRRPPLTVEWKGKHRAPGDEVAPIDLRVDHVYLVSCKYLSRILINASPAHVFDRLLTGGHGRRGGNWYQDVAPAEHQALYDVVRHTVPGLPHDVAALSAEDRRALAHTLRTWPSPDAAERYARLVDAVSTRSAEHWSANLPTLAEREAMLWRLLRIGATPYFVLGASRASPLRLRIATAWDWRQQFELRSFDIAPGAGGQPLVHWHAAVRDKTSAAVRQINGHVEIRWGHRRFGGPPEAKVYLDTPHAEVPGYFALV